MHQRVDVKVFNFKFTIDAMHGWNLDHKNLSVKFFFLAEFGKTTKSLPSNILGYTYSMAFNLVCQTPTQKGRNTAFNRCFFSLSPFWGESGT